MASPEWLERATPARKPLGRGADERLAYKDRMADLRRENLKAGLTELYERTIVTEDARETAKERATLAKLKAIETEPRQEDVWTLPSVSKTVRDALTRRYDRPVVTKKMRRAKKTAHEARLQAKEEEKKEYVHSLYLHAKDFITTQDQLHEEIEKAFGPDDRPVTWKRRNNVWALGTPKGTSELMGLMPEIVAEAPQSGDRERLNRLMQQRLMRIAGQLTGGKIPIPKELETTES